MGGPAPRRSDGHGRRPLYLERASLIEMTERPVLVMSRPLPGEQTQIVRWPVRKARSRRWIFIFGGAAAMATLLAAWLGYAWNRPPASMVAKASPSATIAPAREATVSTRPIVAPLPERPLIIASNVDVPAPPSPPSALARRTSRPVPTGPASGRHTKAAPARLATSSRLAARHRPARATRSITTVAWVDPFIDR